MMAIVMVLGIGLYLRRYATTSDNFFMAGRDMWAWVAGLSFLSANLGVGIDGRGGSVSVRDSGQAFFSLAFCCFSTAS
jgi:Na+/proline symporter